MKFRSLVLFCVMLIVVGVSAEDIHVSTCAGSTNRVQFGVEMLSKSLASAGYKVDN